MLGSKDNLSQNQSQPSSLVGGVSRYNLIPLSEAAIKRNLAGFNYISYRMVLPMPTLVTGEQYSVNTP